MRDYIMFGVIITLSAVLLLNTPRQDQADDTLKKRFVRTFVNWFVDTKIKHIPIEKPDVQDGKVDHYREW